MALRDDPEIAALLAKIAIESAEPSLPEYADLIPPGDDSEFSPAAQAVSDACDSIDIFEVYDRLVGKFRQDPKGKTENVMAICPAHPEKNPSSWFGMKDGKWLLSDGHLGGGKGTGWDKYKLAAFMWGMDADRQFFEVKKRMARDFRGVDYDAITAPLPKPVSKPVSTPQIDPFEEAVRKRLSEKLIDREAYRRAIAHENADLFTPPVMLNLADELEDDDPEIEYTIEGLHTVGTNTTVTAGYKTGKSTLMRNLLKSLVDHEPFLGRHETRQIAGRVAYLNFEIEQVQMKRDLRDMGIKFTNKINMIHLRGHHFDILADAAFQWLVGELKRNEVEVLIVDPYSGAFYGDENDNSQINRFTKRLDELKRQAGVIDLFMPAHTGRSEEASERARGGTKLDDWTDNRWVLVRAKDSPSRFLKGEIRRIGELEERELQFDKATQRLTYSAFAGTRAAVAAKDAASKVLQYIKDHPGVGSDELRKAELGVSTKGLGDAVKKLLAEGDIEQRKGYKGKVGHFEFGTAPITTA